MFLKNIFLRPSGSIRLLSTKRKYPINPEDEKKLPIFEYGASRPSYNRIFVWGCYLTGALGTLSKNHDLKTKTSQHSPKRLTFAEMHNVTSIGCGYGFTLFGVGSSSNAKLYGTGLNTDSQIGFHTVRRNKPLEILFRPQPIILPFKSADKAKVLKVKGGRAHSVILTNEGVFFLGNNSYGQCARRVIPDENYSFTTFINHTALVDDKTISDVQCGQDHTLILTKDGCVYSCGWGADGQTGLGHFNSVSRLTKVNGDIASEKIVKIATSADFNLALNDKGDVFGWGNTEYAQLTTTDGNQQVCDPTFIKMCTKIGKVRDIATGGTFCAAVNEEGGVYVWGYGLLGVGPSVQSSKVPLEIPVTLFGVNDFQPDTCVKSVYCGISHLCAVTNYHDLYAWGRNKHNCLGLGIKNDQHFPLKVALGGYVKDVACGIDHSVALCKPFV